MKYEVSIIIDAPLDDVIAKFDNADNMKKWQPGFVSFEHLSGDAGQPGAKSKLVYKMGRRDVEMVETVTKRDLPREFSGTYEADGVFNVVENYFEADGKDRTRWRAVNEFRFSGWMKLMGWFMPGVFKKTTRDYAQRFKRFVETGEDAST